MDSTPAAGKQKKPRISGALTSTQFTTGNTLASAALCITPARPPRAISRSARLHHPRHQQRATAQRPRYLKGYQKAAIPRAPVAVRPFSEKRFWFTLIPRLAPHHSPLRSGQRANRASQPARASHPGRLWNRRVFVRRLRNDFADRQRGSAARHLHSMRAVRRYQFDRCLKNCGPDWGSTSPIQAAAAPPKTLGRCLNNR
jgi:hypothetical protein